ncbi:MAG: T9SS sorting signal type C domain-containing protein [Flavobacteriales bacterium]
MKKFISLALLCSVLLCYAQKRGELISYELKLDLSAHGIESWIHQNISSDLSIDPTILNFLLFNKKALKAYKVTYWTEDYDQTLLKATGLVMIPDTDQYKTIVTYGHPTTDKKENVPSNLRDALIINFVMPFSYVLNGFVVIAPDYIGLGDGEGIHRYLHAKTEANAVIDMRRASDSLFTILQTKLNGQNFLAGYSQGAHAGMATLKALKEEYNNEYTFDYTFLLSGPYDMSDSNWNHYLSNQEISPFPPVQLSTIYTCNSIGYPLYSNSSEMLKPQYDKAYNDHIVGFANGLSLPGFNLKWKKMFNDDWIAPLLNTSTRSNTPLFQCLRENDVYDWKNTNETTLAFSVIDQVVPYKNTIKTVKTQQNYYSWYDFWNRLKIKPFPVFGGHIIGTAPYLVASNADFSLRRFIYNVSRSFNLKSNRAAQSDEAEITDIIDFNGNQKKSRKSLTTENLDPGVYMLKKQYNDGTVAYEPFAKKERFFLENADPILKKNEQELMISIKELDQTISKITINDDTVPFTIKDHTIHIKNDYLQSLDNTLVIYTQELDEYAFKVPEVEKPLDVSKNIAVYTHENSIFVRSKEKLHTVEVYNLVGQKIFSKGNILNNEYQIPLKNIQGVLIIKVIDQKGNTAQKRVSM